MVLNSYLYFSVTFPTLILTPANIAEIRTIPTQPKASSSPKMDTAVASSTRTTFTRFHRSGSSKQPPPAFPAPFP